MLNLACFARIKRQPVTLQDKVRMEKLKSAIIIIQFMGCLLKQLNEVWKFHLKIC